MKNNQIGENAGKIWKTLDEKGAMDLEQLLRETALDEREMLLALGWLSKERKILHFRNESSEWMVQLIY